MDMLAIKERVRKQMNDDWWASDISLYLKKKKLAEKYPSSNWPKLLIEARAKMVERYGSYAMRGV